VYGRPPILPLEPLEEADRVVVVHTMDRAEASASRASLDSIGCSTEIEESSAGRRRVWLVRVPRRQRVPAAMLAELRFDVEAFRRLPSAPVRRRRLLLTKALAWSAMSEGRFSEALADARLASWAREALGLPEAAVAQARAEAQARFRRHNVIVVGASALAGTAAGVVGLVQGLGAWGFSSLATVGLLVAGASGLALAVFLHLQAR